MHKTTPLLLALLVFWSGCAAFRNASSSEIAYKSLAATAHTVDAAMKGWADYVALGLATPESENKVRDLLGFYQRHAKLAATQAAELNVNTESTALDDALKLVDVAAAHLLSFIEVNQTKEKPKLATPQNKKL